jgi:hypothetical protein
VENASTDLIRAVRGPLLLIAVGALFAIDHFARIPFYRTWPVLLILFGLLKLLERLAADRPARTADNGGEL